MSEGSIWSKANQCLRHTGRVCTASYFRTSLRNVWPLWLFVFSLPGVHLCPIFLPACVKVADVMCFYSDTGGFLPDRVSTLEEVASLHLKVPSSQLSALGMKSQLTAVQSPEMLLLAHGGIWKCRRHLRVIFTGRDGGVAEAALSRAPAEADGSVGGPPSAPQTGTAGSPHDGLHDPGGFVPQQQPL